MNAAPPLFWFVAGAVVASRGVEWWVSLVHERRLRRLGAVRVQPDGFLGIVLAQLVMLGGAAAEVVAASWAGLGPWTWVSLAVAAVAMGVRYWAAVSLGDRYTVRVWQVTAPLVRRGPYRWARHPIYAAVAVEVVTLACAFGAWLTAAIGGLLNLGALARRIRMEERALVPRQP